MKLITVFPVLQKDTTFSFQSSVRTHSENFVLRESILGISSHVGMMSLLL